MTYPRGVLEKAQRLEQLLLGVATSKPLAALNETLGFDLDEEELAHQQTKYADGGRTWEALIDGRHGHAHKCHSGIREYLYTRKENDASLRARQLADAVADKFGVEVSVGHVNYLLRKRELTAPRGHPPQKPTTAAEVRQPPVKNVGIFFPGSSEGGAGSR